MEQTTENIATMAERLSLYSHYPNFPKTDAALVELAKSILRFTHNKPIKCSALAGTTGKGEQKVSNSINDVEALFAWLQDENEFFPVTFKMRQWHQRYFPPADGKEVTREPEAYGSLEDE